MDTDANGQGVVDSQRQLVRQNDAISDRTFAIEFRTLEFMPTLSRSAEHPLSMAMRTSAELCTGDFHHLFSALFDHLVSE